MRTRLTLLWPVLLVATIAGVPSAASAPVQAGPTSTASVFVSPAGSDTAQCTKASPCATLNRAYAVARPGKTVEVAGGTYPAQTIAWRPGRDRAAQVVFHPTGKVTIDGDLNVYASGVRIAGRASGSITSWRSRTYSILVKGDMAVLGDSATQHPHNVTLEGIDGGSLGTYTSENVVVRDIDAGPVLLGAPCRRAESKIGPNVDEQFVPRNITWERVVVHGMDLDASALKANCHYGGLFIVSVRNLTIRDSVFTENVVYNIQVQNYVGAPATDVVIQNSWFGCPVLGSATVADAACNGQSSIQFNAASLFANWLLRYNSFSGSGASGADAYRASFQNVRFVGNAGRPPAPDVCRRPGVAFTSNAWVDNTCGVSDREISDPFVSTTPGREDLHLLSSTPAKGLVGGSTPDVTVRWDIDGRMRPLRLGRDAGSAQHESAEIVRWRAIGAAELGDNRSDVIARYGRPRASTVHQGTRTDTYRRPGGKLWLRYREDRAIEVGTTSPYYSTSAGIGPGVEASVARRQLGGSWSPCRGVYRRASGRNLVYLRSNRIGSGTISSVLILERAAELPCRPKR